MSLQPLHRRLLIGLAILLLLPVIFVAGALAVVESQWAENWVEARMASALGREVDLEGIDVELGRPLAVGFKRLRIGNPSWAETKSLIDAYDLQALVEIAPLFEGRFEVAYLGAKKASFGIERFQDRASWKFTEGERGESRLQLSRVFVHDGQLYYRKKDDATAIDFQVTGALGEDQKVEWSGKGTFRNLPAEGTGTLPSMAAKFGQPIPVVAKARIGKTDFTVDGTVAANLRTLDFKFTLAGQSMKDLRTLFKLNMPETPPYRMNGTLERDGAVWKFNPIQGKIGESDVRGHFTVDRSGKQPRLTASFQSKLLDLDDVGPMITQPAGAPAKPAAQKPEGGKFFPDVAFNSARWGEMDADVRLKVDRVKRPKQLPLENMAAHVTMKSKVLRLHPIEFGIAGGRFKSNVTLDASKKPVQGNMDMQLSGLSIARMFPTVKSMENSFGTLYGQGKLSGTGETMNDLLASSHGDLGIAVNGGQVSLLLVELLGLDFGEALGMLGTKNKQVALRCAAGAFNVQKGVIHTERFIIDTTDTVVKIEGTMSLADEKLNLVTYPEPKDMSFFALRSPIVVEGSLKKPSVRPKGGPIAARLAGAAVLAAIAPPLAALAFIETGPGKDTDCGKLLAEANAKGAPKKQS